jgi:hypothetical protein
LDDFKNFGINAEEELIKILSEELSKNIDAEILKGLGLDRITLRKNKIKRITEKLK